MKIVKTINEASKIARMHRNTTRKYLKAKKPPSGLKNTPSRKILKPVIQDCHWKEISALLEESSELEATAAMDYLKDKYPPQCTGKEVISPQVYRPGEKIQSDFIHINQNTVTIKAQKFPHLLFHFTLTYSNWKYVKICQGEKALKTFVLALKKASML